MPQEHVFSLPTWHRATLSFGLQGDTQTMSYSILSTLSPHHFYIYQFCPLGKFRKMLKTTQKCQKLN